MWKAFWSETAYIIWVSESLKYTSDCLRPRSYVCTWHARVYTSTNIYPHTVIDFYWRLYAANPGSQAGKYARILHHREQVSCAWPKYFYSPTDGVAWLGWSVIVTWFFSFQQPHAVLSEVAKLIPSVLVFLFFFKGKHTKERHLLKGFVFIF